MNGNIFFRMIFLSLLLLCISCNKLEPTFDFTTLSTTVLQTEFFLRQTASITPEQILSDISSTPSPVSNGTNTPEPPSKTPTKMITPTPNCTDKARFISETVPDGTMFSSGEKFVKTWVLKNEGTCIWSKDYSIINVDGELLGVNRSINILDITQPGEILEIVLTFTTPDKAGEYRSDWKLSNNRGEIFGLGSDNDRSFWVDIISKENQESQLDLGTPDWLETFDSDEETIFLGIDNNISFSLKNGKLVMTVFEPGGDQWRLFDTKSKSDFYLESNFIVGDKCSGKDSYGFIVRSPKNESKFVDSGYVIGFSCDGSYRLYRMDAGYFIEIVNWTTSPSINSGPDQENKIGLLAQGSIFKIYINGVLIDEFEDSTYPNGQFGLMVRSENTNDFQVSVNQIATWDIP